MKSVRLGLAAALLSSAGALAQSNPVKVENAWARATPPRAEVGAVYMTLTASGPDRLVGVSTPAAAKAEVHEMSTENGVMRMRETPGIMLPAGQPVVLGPGGYHVMLMGLKGPLKQGQTVPLHLTFASAPPVDVTAAVGDIGGSAPAR
jgi:copper(I)-binding protein